jgi:alpha-amylase
MPSISIFKALVALLATIPLASALNQLDLRQRSVYQVLTDRFAREDGQNTYCDVTRREHCGGTWRGIITQLDYIQEMGFDTGRSELVDRADGIVWISPVVANIEGMTFDGGAYHGMYFRSFDWNRLTIRLLELRYHQYVRVSDPGLNE